MTDPILCPDCGHDIDDHQTFETAKSRDFPCRVPPCECWNEPSTIARAYADERVRDALRPVPTDKEKEVMTEHRLQMVDDDDAITTIFDMRLTSALGDRKDHHE